MAVTLADVARRAGTSTAVVSYVMNNGPRPVAEATRERVLAAASELGYRPNRIARALRSRTTGVVGLVLADSSNPYFAALARHVEHALHQHDKLTLIGNTGYAADRQRHLVERFLAAQVDGLVIASEEGGPDVAAEAETAGVPAVYVHNRPASGRSPVVSADNGPAVREAVAHLREHGHRHIAFLTGPNDAGPVGERCRAWREAVGGEGDEAVDGEGGDGVGGSGTGKRGDGAGRGGTGDGAQQAAPASELTPLLLRCDYARAAAADLTRRLIAEGGMPRALITATDEQAVGVLAGAHAAGLPVPEGLAVISLDGSPESAYTAPALTVTRQPLQEMAAHAVNCLLTGAPDAPAMTAPLVRRGSCGCGAGDEGD